MAVTISLSITQNSRNIENNTSNVTVKCTASWTYGSWNKTGQCTGTMTIDGTKYSFSGITFNDKETTTGSKVVMEKNLNIAHNDDGEKELSCSATFNTFISSGTVNASASKTLTPIERASQPSCITYPEHTQNVGEFGDEISIHMNRKSSAFTHTVRYKFGSKSGTIATDVGTGTKWTIPLSLMDLLPADTQGSGTIYVDTYKGSTKIGTKSCGFTAKVPTSVKPTCSLTLEDTTGVDDIYGSPVKGLSKIKVTVTAEPAYGSPIASTVITVNGVRYNGTTATSDVLKESGNSNVSASVTDKRGRGAGATYRMNVQAYTAPSVTKLTAARCNQDGTPNKRGAYIKVTFSASVSSMNGKNNATYKLKYKKTSETAYSSKSLSDLANNYAPTNYTYIFAAAAGNSYDVVVEATDRHKTGAKSAKAPTAAAIFSWRGFKTDSGKQDGAGIGKVPEKPNTLQVGWDAEFEKDMVQKGNMYAYQSISFEGTKGYNLVAVITINALNANACIVFELNKRGALYPMKVYVRFASSSETKDPDLTSITYEGQNFGAFLVKSATSTWKLYVDDTTGWAIPCVQRWYTTQNQGGRISVSHQDEKIEGTDPKVLGTYYRATPAKMESLLDYIYPVGSIYLSYSHVSPESLFGGSWERIQNAFLWAVDANGDIGATGGSKTHTLTVDELPSHSHGSVYSGMATGTKNTAWLASGGDKMAYGALNAGGGKAHNNMPPYIQVSAWRRTA